jgi:secreted PhoX family phosphatase
MKRYGLKSEDRGFGWYNTDQRFDLSLHPNEANRFGYILEIDPLNPNSRPKKLSALGRFKHENAGLVINHDNRVVVYMGDDERGEFLYRFISDATYVPWGDNTQILENGSLYVAKFQDNARGTWTELTPETTGMDSQAAISVYTRQAGSLVGATTMDRPEWIAIPPDDSAVYCCLTNNKHRGKKANAGGDATPVGGPNPRVSNKYGQIIRWQPDANDHAGPNFSWNIFALAGNPFVHSDLNAGSPNITLENIFNSPDGIAFDSLGRLWIQTDGDYSNEGDFLGMGNNQMLVANTNTGEIRRFLVGPKECELTGITWAHDKKTMFVGIQHPGERGHSHFPEGGQSLPRSSIIAIRRDNGHTIG